MMQDIKKFGEDVREHLTTKIIPFWKSLRDEEYGGYYGWLDYDMKLDKQAVKGCILNRRILWFFSNAYLLSLIHIYGRNDDETGKSVEIKIG